MKESTRLKLENALKEIEEIEKQIEQNSESVNLLKKLRKKKKNYVDVMNWYELQRNK